jgi:uncharacterized protein (DUF58 family)
MLYPDFNDLISLKDSRGDLTRKSNQPTKSGISGNHLSAFQGRGMEFDTVREYVLGDDIRNIDWRVTARTGSPHLKLFKEARERSLVICVDMNSSMRFGTRNTFKSVQAARIAALLGWRGLSHQDSVGACLFGDIPDRIQFFPPKRTKGSLCTVLKKFTEPFPERYHIQLDEVFFKINQNAPTGSDIYFISDFLDINDSFFHNVGVSRLTTRCNVIFISINDPADKSISSVGTIGFCGNNKEKIYLNTDMIAGKEAYAEQWKENRHLLSEISTKFQIPILELSTESDASRDLILGLKSLAKRRKL